MSVTSFFAETLGAKLRSRQYWGGVDALGRIFLKVDRDTIETTPDGQRIEVEIDQPNISHGYPHRHQQVLQIAGGAEAYGVLCTPKPRGGFKGFDERTLLQLGKLTRKGDRTFADIVGRIPVEQVVNSSCLAKDLQDIQSLDLEKTTKAALIDARIGQGKFRNQVLKLWENRCAVTQSTTLAVIRASHIKPWRASSHGERLDPNNGLPLVANLDALFDVGLITFDPAGQMVVSPKLPESERKLLQLEQGALVRSPNSQTAQFMAYHREHQFRR